MPPSIQSSAPVMKRLASEARNRATAATSSGYPIRPSGIFDDEPGAELVAGGFEHGVVDGPRTQRVHSDPAGRQLCSPGAGEGARRRLRAIVGGITRRADEAGDGADYYHCRAVRQHWQGAPHGERGGADAEVEGLVELLPVCVRGDVMPRSVKAFAILRAAWPGEGAESRSSRVAVSPGSLVKTTSG